MELILKVNLILLQHYIPLDNDDDGIDSVFNLTIKVFQIL